MRNTSIDALNTIERYQQFFTCVDQAAQTYAHPGQKVVVFLISDSEVLKEEALRRFDGRVVVSGLGVSHLEIEKGASGWKGVKGAADGMMNAIAEWYTLAGKLLGRPSLLRLSLLIVVFAIRYRLSNPYRTKRVRQTG